MTSRFSQVVIIVLLFVGLLARSPLLLLLDVLLLIGFGSSASSFGLRWRLFFS